MVPGKFRSPGACHFDSPVHTDRYPIADNRHVERGGWLQDELRSLLFDFASGTDLAGTGYDEVIKGHPRR